MVTIGQNDTQPATTDAPDTTQAVVEPQTTADPTQTQTQTTPGLTIADSPQSVENIPADEEGALSLQQIYEKVIPSVASISCVQQGAPPAARAS